VQAFCLECLTTGQGLRTLCNPGREFLRGGEGRKGRTLSLASDVMHVATPHGRTAARSERRTAFTARHILCCRLACAQLADEAEHVSGVLLAAKALLNFRTAGLAPALTATTGVALRRLRLLIQLAAQADEWLVRGGAALLTMPAPCALVDTGGAPEMVNDHVAELSDLAVGALNRITVGVLLAALICGFSGPPGFRITLQGARLADPPAACPAACGLCGQP